MRILCIPVAFALLALTACDKDKFNTKPTLTIKAISSYNVPVSGNVSFRFDFTDKEGDISNLLYVKKIRTNRRVVPTLRDSFALSVPQFPKKQNGEVEVRMEYQNYLISAINPPTSGVPPKAENDTLIFKFCLKDEANNLSDTITTDKIVVVR